MKQLQTLSIVSPGFYGLNTQESGASISSNFAQLTDNVIIDKYGRLGARKGWLMKTDSGESSLGGAPIRFMLEHFNADNTTTLLSAGNNKLFKNGNGDALVDITPASYTISDNDWSGASIYDHAIFVQENHEPVIYSAAATPNAQTITSFTGATQNFGTNYPHNVIAAYGRFWSHTDTTIYWSTDIADTSFPCFCGGTSGVLNISAVLPHNVDKIIGIAVHNDFLVIFCRNNIIVYRGASNPIDSGFALQDIIAGVGCTAKNSIQPTGNDLIFLSDTGVRSLGRVMQEKSMPMRDLTKNVRDDLLKDMAAEITNYGSLDHVASVYSETNAFYMVSFPSLKTVYVLDMRSPLQDGASRVTVWYEYEAYSLISLTSRELLIGKTNGIGSYGGYTDNGVKYRLRFFSPYIDLQSPTAIKLLKQVKVTVLGGNNQQFTIKIGTDYSGAHRSFPFIISSGGMVSEYGISEYNVGEYTVGVGVDSIKSSVAGSGNTFQVGFEADVNGSELSIQTIDCFVKTGRVN